MKEVSFFKQLEKQVPENAESLYEKYETYRLYQIQLTYIIYSYNRIIDTITELDYSIVADEFSFIDFELKKLINSSKWKSESIKIIFLLQFIKNK
jgi:hypothetical protein